MLQIGHFEIEGHFTKIRRLGVEGDIVDVGAGLADERRQGAQSSGLVDRRCNKTRRKQLSTIPIEIPANVEPTIWLVIECGERR